MTVVDENICEVKSADYINMDFKGKRLTILGSTGSIGTNALEVAEKLGCTITALAAHSNVELIERQIRRFRPSLAVLFSEQAAADLKQRVRDLPVKVSTGMDGLCEAAAADTDLVLNSVVGMIGLMPTLAAINAGHNVALANKETLVAGGPVVINAAERSGVKLIPVDSEHSAIFQCLQCSPPNKAVKRLILTASGGPFFGKSEQELEFVSPKEALRHPNWKMGSKITIDSATMMNKGLEIIEARWLFDVKAENIDVVIHRESIVHSIVEFSDNSVLAQLGVPDMKIPIQYAITWPFRLECDVKPLDLTELGALSFYPPDLRTFRGIEVCRKAVATGGLYPAAVNAANEAAVALFLENKIGFMDITRLVESSLEYSLPEFGGRVEQILEVDRMVREDTIAKAKKIKR